MDTILVVSYSYTGVSRCAAKLLCSQEGWPHGEIVDTAPRGTLRCVLDSLLRRHPSIRYQGPEPADFRTVVLVSPIWAYRLAGPMRTFVRDRREALRRVAVVTTMGSGGASNAVKEIAAILGHPPIDAVAFTQLELEDGTATTRLLAFGQQLLPESTAKQRPRVAAWSVPGAPSNPSSAH
ncbi:MAG TPA: flavodoxin [Ramlibacter sp.]|nr:flavodoxin [Ramlibacter sp.]